MALSFQVNPAYARIDEIIPGLFISGVSALNVSTMDEHRISYIINATNEVGCLSQLPYVQKFPIDPY